MKKTILRKTSTALEKIMQTKGITPKMLSQKTKIGYSTLAPIIKGHRDFGITKLVAIAEALECSPDVILNNKPINSLVELKRPQSIPKYLAIFISFSSVTHCMVYETDTSNKKTGVFKFALACGQNHEDFIDRISTSIQNMISPNPTNSVKTNDIGVFVSVQQFEWSTNRSKIQQYGNRAFAYFIIESDAITNYRALFGEKKGIVVTINDGDGITYCPSDRKDIIKLQGYGFPLSDVAGTCWIGCEAIKYAISVKEGIETSSPLSDRVLALFNNDLFSVSENIHDDADNIYAKAASTVRELLFEDRKAHDVIKQSANLLLQRIQLLDVKLKIKLPIALAGELANMYKNFFPSERLVELKNKLSDHLLNHGLKFLLKILREDKSGSS